MLVGTARELIGRERRRGQSPPAHLGRRGVPFPPPFLLVANRNGRRAPPAVAPIQALYGSGHPRLPFGGIGVDPLLGRVLGGHALVRDRIGDRVLVLVGPF